MQSIYRDTRILDKAVREKFCLTEDIMMENAASGLEKAVVEAVGNSSGKQKNVLILCGSGNNGADGYALARRLCGKYPVTVCACGEPKSELCVLQKKRCEKAGVSFVSLEDCCSSKSCSSSEESAAGSENCVSSERIVARSEDCVSSERIAAGSESCVSSERIVAGSENCVSSERIVAGSENGTSSEHSCAASELNNSPVIVDCIFGSGFHGSLPESVSNLIKKINSTESKRIACDVPTGLDVNGNAEGEIFCADVTVTMGAQKMCLYSDKAKDFTGRIILEDLGVSRTLFENSAAESECGLPEAFLLEQKDFVPPLRKNQNVNKGSFGHTSVVCGDKAGASVIASCAALKFGTGLVTLVDFSKEHESGEKILLDSDGMMANENIIPYEIMCSSKFPPASNSIAIGMGFGRQNKFFPEYFNYIEEKLNESPETGIVLDADIFYYPELKTFLKKQSETGGRKIVLTPHPKEFVELIKNCLPEEYESFGFPKLNGSNAVKHAVENRIALIKKFCGEYKGIVLLLKGANPVVGMMEQSEKNITESERNQMGSTEKMCGGKMKLYINPLGTNALAKAGSGDVLGGLTAALLSQKYSPLEAAVNATLAHAIASSLMENNFALTPFSLLRLIETVNLKNAQK